MILFYHLILSANLTTDMNHGLKLDILIDAAKENEISKAVVGEGRDVEDSPSE